MHADRTCALRALPLLFLLGGCDWFTDFRDQPKYEPWESEADSIPFRANPQMSVPLGGMSVPGLVVSYRPLPLVIDSIAAIATNPIAADARSLENGRKSYQINCAVCHGVAGRGDGPVTRYGVPGIGLVSPRAAAFSDGYLYGMIRNGRGMMPTYNRIPETERWDLVNYLRGLQGRHQVAAAPAGYPGETGAALPSADAMAPTRPAPDYLRRGSQAGLPLGASAQRPGAVAPADSARADTAGTAATPAPAVTPTPGVRP